MTQPPLQPGGYPPPQTGNPPQMGYPPQTGFPPQGDQPPAAQPGLGTPLPPPKKKSGALKIVLIVFAVLLVLCLGGAAAIYFAAKDEIKGAVDGVVAAQNTRLVAPETLAGRPKITQGELQTAADQMAADFKKDIPGATSTVGGFYGDAAKQDLVMVAGASAPVLNPAQELDKTISDLATADLPVTGAASVDPGPLGGVAKCGNTKADEVPAAVCVWADSGSVGMIVLYFKDANALKTEFVKMRGEIEQRS